MEKWKLFMEHIENITNQEVELTFHEWETAHRHDTFFKVNDQTETKTHFCVNTQNHWNVKVTEELEGLSDHSPALGLSMLHTS